MNEFMKIVLSLSVSGTLLLLLILGLKPLYKDRFSRRWQYYIWIVAALRFLLPFTPETTVVGSLFERFGTAAITSEIPEDQDVPVSVNADNSKAEPIQTDGNMTAATAAHKSFDVYACLFLIWSVSALALFVRKVTVYQGFIRYIKAGNTEVSDIKILNLLSDCAEKLNIKTRVEVSCNPLVASPMMTGFFRPNIVLPARDLGGKELSYVFVHELTHYKQKDMFYKWLIQLAVCVHWFNPFVYLLEKEVNRSCELSCDEKVISVLDGKARREYGDTLIAFLRSDDPCKSSFTSVTLTEGAEQLKERLGAIMNFKKKNKVTRILTGVLTLCIVFIAAFVGGYHVANASMPTNIDDSSLMQSGDVPTMETLEIKGTTYYLVSNEAQLRAIGTGEYGMEQNYMQQADIQLSENEWIPIGTWDDPFTGTYNGNGFEITGLTMKNPDAKLVGLFGVARDNAQIYNITLRDFDTASAGENAANISAGAIVAIAYGGRAYDNFVYPEETGEYAASPAANDNPDESLKDQNIGRSVRITKEELSDELREIINSCDTETWYVIERAGYQYIYYGGLPHNYAYQPEIYTNRDHGTVNIFDADVSIDSTGYVLLEIQQNISLTINYNGTQITYTQL